MQLLPLHSNPRSRLIAALWLPALAGLACQPPAPKVVPPAMMIVADAGPDAGSDAGEKLDTDAGPDLRDAGPPCPDSLPCRPPDSCTVGLSECLNGLPVCTSTGQPDPFLEGAACDGGTCQSGICSSCVESAGCSVPTACHLGRIHCDRGIAACQDVGADPSQNGAVCGTDLVCLDGACSPCTAGVACTPSNICDLGTIDCTTGAPVCQDSSLPDFHLNWLPCGDAGLCVSGTCTQRGLANHDPFPIVPNNGGEILAAPRLVTVTFDGYPYRAEVEAYDQWLSASDWLTTVGADYGVGLGSSVNIEVSDVPPTSATDTDVATFVADLITRGAAPLPVPGDDVIFMVFYPSTTTLTAGGGFNSCSSFLAYHTWETYKNVPVAFAAMADCHHSSTAAEIKQIEIGASHETIEAATDPYFDAPGGKDSSGFVFEDPAIPWIAFSGAEVGDLCNTFNFQDPDAGYWAQQIWSNAAAYAGAGSPCIPAPATPYFNVSPNPDGPLSIAAGGTTNLTLTGWSSVAAASWSLSAYAEGDFDPNGQLSSTTISTGGTVTLTLDVPSGTPSGATAWLILLSLDSGGGLVSYWPLEINVP